MQHAVADLLGSALVPELGTDVAARTTSDIHLLLVTIAAIGALPHQLAVILHDLDLAVITADLTVIGFGVQLRIHDVVIDELQHTYDGFQIVLHVGHFHIADGTARGQALEVGFKLQLGEGINLLRHMHMVAVGDIVLVGNAGHDAKPLLQALGELVGGGFQRGAIEGVVHVLGLLPLVALVVHVLHHAEGEGLCAGVGVALAGHILHALIQAGVTEADGGVAAEEQLVDLLALLEAGQCAVLPQDGCGIAGSAQQPLVPCLQCAVAQGQTLVENLPELLLILARGQGHVHQVDGNHTLVEPAVVLGLAGLGVHIGGQEAAAAHAGVAVAFAVFVHLELQHLLFGDIVGHHALCGTLCGQLGQIIVGSAGADVVLFQHIDQLGESGGDPHTGLVLHALIALADGLLDDDGKVCLLLRIARLTQIHEHKGRQELFSRQKPVELEKLTEVAKVQSVESSNRIEGIITTSTRIGQIVKEKTTPKNRDEKEIAGYRDVLNTIHESHDYISITSNIILQLHRDLTKYSESGLGGTYKITQNYLKETRPDGSEFIRFTPVLPYETAPCIEAICENYKQATQSEKIDPLLLIPVFIHDFLCIHPFNDGNGRMSRLLTLLLLYRNGYEVGKYISIEKHIEKTKGAYYDALEEASKGWHEETDDPTPFIKYMLGVVLACYREFEERVQIIGESTAIEIKGGKPKSVAVKSKAYDIVKAAVDTKVGKFTKKEIANICPSISEKSVEAALRKLVDEQYIERHGTGKNSFYAKVSS